MGVLFSGASPTAIKIDCRTIASLFVVATAKLHRNERLMPASRGADAVGDGRGAVWINATSDLRVKYRESKPPAVDAILVKRMMTSSIRLSGSELTEESITHAPNTSSDITRNRPNYG